MRFILVYVVTGSTADLKGGAPPEGEASLATLHPFPMRPPYLMCIEYRTETSWIVQLLRQSHTFRPLEKSCSSVEWIVGSPSRFLTPTL